MYLAQIMEENHGFMIGFVPDLPQKPSQKVFLLLKF